MGGAVLVSDQRGGGTDGAGIYPLTITLDRYGGLYSKGEYLAWKLYPWDVPMEPFSNDGTCMEFWDTYNGTVGTGETPEAAVKYLESKLIQAG